MSLSRSSEVAKNEIAEHPEDKEEGEQEDGVGPEGHSGPAGSGQDVVGRYDLGSSHASVEPGILLRATANQQSSSLLLLALKVSPFIYIWSRSPDSSFFFFFAEAVSLSVTGLGLKQYSNMEHAVVLPLVRLLTLPDVGRYEGFTQAHSRDISKQRYSAIFRITIIVLSARAVKCPRRSLTPPRED